MGLLSRTKPAGANTTTTNFDLNDMGVMPTMKRQVLGNGMVLGLEQNSVWLYGKVPTAPVANARDAQQRLDAYGPLFQTLDQIAAETPRAALKRRSVTKNSYRNIHILRTNVPKTWHADTVAPRDRRQGQDTLNQWLNVSLPETTVKEAVLALGVQLVPSTTSTGMKGALDSVVFTLLEGGTPLVDFERDLEKVKRIFDRTGLTALSGSEIASLDSWWNPGRNPDVVTLGHPDHLHVIRDKRTTRAIKKLEEDGVDCEDWPADIKESADQKAGQAVVSFGSISDVKLNFVDPVEDAELANWALPLLNARALAISIRGAVEPAEITREELRRNKRNYKNDITERVKNNKMERQEQEEKVGVLGQVESVYANSRGTPTLISTSGLVAFDGKVEDWDTVVRSAADLQAMEHRQSKAWAEMMICSMRNANPNLMDMPIQNIACSGINDVSRIGDKHGIMRGFTESDKQPAYYDVEAAYAITEDATMAINIGASGSGKTLLMQWEMFQTNLLGYPQIVVDPKAGSNLTPVVEAMPNGRVYSLDELADHDGIFDGVKFSPNPDVAIEFALATLTSLNPYGSDRDMAAAEPDLIEALRYGINRGHRSTLTALKRAVKDGKLDEHHVTQIEKLSTSSPMFTALVGHSDEGEGLGEFEGTTLIKVGDQELNLPEPGTPPSGIIQRVNLALVRNIVFASAMALNKRKGVLRLDEAWVFTSNSPRELERLGRLARSQTIDVQLYTQRISDALDANLRNYITRGLILHMRDPVEAKAACAVFDLEPTPERVGRIRAKGTLDNDSASPNWNSLKALKDPVTREVIRGSVGLYVDIHGRVVPVEIRVSERFLKLASTNIDDIQAREAQDAETSREAALAR